jgi:hypothetical protein
MTPGLAQARRGLMLTLLLAAAGWRAAGAPNVVTPGYGN